MYAAGVVLRLCRVLISQCNGWPMMAQQRPTIPNPRLTVRLRKWTSVAFLDAVPLALRQGLSHAKKNPPVFLSQTTKPDWNFGASGEGLPTATHCSAARICRFHGVLYSRSGCFQMGFLAWTGRTWQNAARATGSSLADGGHLWTFDEFGHVLSTFWTLDQCHDIPWTSSLCLSTPGNALDWAACLAGLKLKSSFWRPIQ